MCSSASLFPSSLPHPQEQKTIARDRRRNMEDTFPVIDAEKINCEEGECKKLREACERWGCFMADMKKVVEALVVTWDKMHSALYMRPWVSMTCVPHKLCRFSVLNLMTRSTRGSFPMSHSSLFLSLIFLYLFFYCFFSNCKI